MWVCTHVSGWSVCNQKMYTHTRTHIYIHTYTHTHKYTHTLEFRGNTSILSSPSSKVGLFLPHLVVTWLLSANQGFFLNQPLPPPSPQDMFLKVFSQRQQPTLVYANRSLLQWLFPDSFQTWTQDYNCPLFSGDLGYYKKKKIKSWFNIISFINANCSVFFCWVVKGGGFWKWVGLQVDLFFWKEWIKPQLKWLQIIKEKRRKTRLLHLCKQNCHFAWCVHNV